MVENAQALARGWLQRVDHSNEILHAMNTCSTISSYISSLVPNDRDMDAAKREFWYKMCMNEVNVIVLLDKPVTSILKSTFKAVKRMKAEDALVFTRETHGNGQYTNTVSTSMVYAVCRQGEGYTMPPIATELLEHIVSFSDLATMSSATRVCREWNNAVSRFDYSSCAFDMVGTRENPKQALKKFSTFHSRLYDGSLRHLFDCSSRAGRIMNVTKGVAGNIEAFLHYGFKATYTSTGFVEVATCCPSPLIDVSDPATDGTVVGVTRDGELTMLVPDVGILDVDSRLFMYNRPWVTWPASSCRIYVSVPPRIFLLTNNNGSWDASALKREGDSSYRWYARQGNAVVPTLYGALTCNGRGGVYFASSSIVQRVPTLYPNVERMSKVNDLTQHSIVLCGLYPGRATHATVLDCGDPGMPVPLRNIEMSPCYLCNRYPIFPMGDLFVQPMNGVVRVISSRHREAFDRPYHLGAWAMRYIGDKIILWGGSDVWEFMSTPPPQQAQLAFETEHLGMPRGLAQAPLA